jgi:RNA polymerase sigma-70 factor (ECF subfamily)
VLTRLAHEYARAGKAELFRRLQHALTGRTDATSHHDVASALNMSDAAVRVAAHRLRRRYRDLLREEVGRTVSEPTAVDDEIRYLRRIVARDR